MDSSNNSYGLYNESFNYDISHHKLVSSKSVFILPQKSIGGGVYPQVIANLGPIKTCAIICTLLLLWVNLISKNRSDKSHATLEAQYGCKKAVKLKTHWFFGIDRPLQVFAAGKGGRVLRFFQSLVAETGNTFEWTVLGSRVWGTQDPENLKVMLSTKEKSFSHEVRRVVTDSLIGNGVFSQDGAAWKHSRSLLKPSLFQKHYNDSTLIEEHVDNFISRIATERIVDLQPLFFCLTLDLTTSFLFGKSVYSLKQDQGRAEKDFSQAFQYAQVYLSRRYQLGRLCWLLNGKKYRDSCDIVHSYIDGIVQGAVREKNSSHADGHRPLLGELVLDVDDPIRARDHLIHLLLAGRDTAACLLSWTFILLCRHQHVLRRLQAELSGTFGSGSVDISRARKLPYLSCILKEVLRLYPPVPVNSRTAAEDVVLPRGGGADGMSSVLVRRGEDVAVCVYTMHRRQDLYGLDSEDFRPERWENGALDHIENSYGYLPFHGGRRVCPGQQFALSNASYTIARLLKEFPDITLPAGTLVPELGTEKQILGLTLSSGDGCLVQLREESLSI